jgi:hypothetical protein
MVYLKIPPKKAVLLLEETVGEIERMITAKHVFEYYTFIGWCSRVWSTIDEIFGDESPHPEEIRNIGAPSCTCNNSVAVQLMILEAYHSCLLDYIDEIQKMDKEPEK